jgi:hypothetical protein
LWLSQLLISALLIGAFYWYLFQRPFYAVRVLPDGQWALVYALPTRETRVTPVEISALTTENELLPIRRAGQRRQQLVIELRDGRHFISAPAPQDDIAVRRQELRSRIEP